MRVSCRHLSDVQIYPLAGHPAPPLAKCCLIRCLGFTWPISQPIRASARDNFRYCVPCKARGAIHVHCVPRAKTDDLTISPIIMADQKEAIAAKTDTDQAYITLLTDIPMRAQCVARRINIQDGCLCFCLRESCAQQLGNISRECRRGPEGYSLAVQSY